MNRLTTVIGRRARKKLDVNYLNPKQVTKHRFSREDKTRFGLTPMKDFFSIQEEGFKFFDAGSNTEYHKAVSEIAQIHYRRCASLSSNQKGLTLLSERRGGASEIVQTTYSKVGDKVLINTPNEDATKSFITNGSDSTIRNAVISAKDSEGENIFIKAAIRNDDGTPKDGITIKKSANDFNQIEVSFDNFECEAELIIDDITDVKKERLAASIYQLGEIRLALKQINQIGRQRQIIDASGEASIPLNNSFKQELTSVIAKYMAAFTCCKTAMIDLSNIKINSLKIQLHDLLCNVKTLLSSMGGSVNTVFPNESKLHLWPGDNRILTQEVARDVINEEGYANYSWTDEDFRVIYPNVLLVLRLVELSEGVDSASRFRRIFKAREKATRVVLSQQVVAADVNKVNAYEYWISSCSDHTQSFFRSVTERQFFHDFTQCAQIAQPSISPTLNSWALLYGMNCILSDIHYFTYRKLVTVPRYSELVQLQKEYVDDLVLDAPSIIDCL